jgi:hypothetical protein
MPFARSDWNGVRLIAEEIAKLDGERKWGWRMENPRMRGHAEKSTENKIGDTECLRASDHFLDPLPETPMISGVFAMCVDQDVDVGQNHDRSP